MCDKFSLFLVVFQSQHQQRTRTSKRKPLTATEEAKEDKVQMRLVRALHEPSYEVHRLYEEEDRLCPEDRV